MKPPGIALTPFPKVVMPSRTEDAIYKAVEEAIENGWTVEQFRAEARLCWTIVHDQQKRAAMKAFDK